MMPGEQKTERRSVMKNGLRLQPIKRPRMEVTKDPDGQNHPSCATPGFTKQRKAALMRVIHENGWKSISHSMWTPAGLTATRPVAGGENADRRAASRRPYHCHSAFSWRRRSRPADSRDAVSHRQAVSHWNRYSAGPTADSTRTPSRLMVSPRGRARRLPSR